MIMVETHCHTGNVSPCGMVDGETIISDYAKAGYGIVITTDHYYQRLWDKKKSWAENAAFYLSGFRRCLAAGEQMGVKVFLGMEIQFDGDAPHDYLVYGPDEAFVLSHPYLNEMEPRVFQQLAAQHGFLMFCAHPYRKGAQPAEPPFCDGVEIYNGHPRHFSRNKLALEFADSYSLMTSSGSDYHMREDVARGGIMVPDHIASMADLVAYLKERRHPELIITFDDKGKR